MCQALEHFWLSSNSDQTKEGNIPFNEQMIVNHDIFSIIFMVMLLKQPNLPLVFEYYKNNPAILINFNSEKFLEQVDDFLHHIQEDPNLVKIVKRLVNYDYLQDGGFIYYGEDLVVRNLRSRFDGVSIWN